jgi:hypothetical protein
MNDLRLKITSLSAQGFQCSQIMVMLGLDAKNGKNLTLLKAVEGLAFGCGEGSCTCGALTGGCCLMAILTDTLVSDDNCQSDSRKMTCEIVSWFWNKYGFKIGGIDCMAIMEANVAEQGETRCWILIEDIYQQIIHILLANGYYLRDSGNHSTSE